MGRPMLRSVDSECAGRVIEPRKASFRGSRRRSTHGRPHRYAEIGLACSIPPGSEKSRACTQGVLQEPERSCRLRIYTGPERGNRHSKPLAYRPALRPDGRYETATQGWYRQAKETKCGGMGGRKSEHPTVPWKQGNSSQRTLWREGDAESSNPWRETWRVHRNSQPCQRNFKG
jgi:hypothetical protein